MVSIKVVIAMVTLLSSSVKYVDIFDKVSRLLLTPPIKSVILFFTNSVVAIWVVFVLDIAVGASGIPVKVGEIFGAFNEVNVVIWD